jgi:hypothetical protein
VIAPSELALRFAHSPAHGAFRTGKAHLAQPAKHHVSAYFAPRALHPFLDLSEVGVDLALPTLHLPGDGQLAGVTFRHPGRHGVMRTAHSSAASRKLAVKSNASSISMISSRDFMCSCRSIGVASHRPVDSGGAPNARMALGNGRQRGQITCPPLGNFVGHQRAVS